MAVNLLNTHTYTSSLEILDHSFAQWEADVSARELSVQMRKLTDSLESYENAFHCDFGDFKQLLTIRMELTDLERRVRRNVKKRRFTSPKARQKALDRLDRRIDYLHRCERNHPCQKCPDFQDHMRWGRHWMRERQELDRLENRYESRTGSVSRKFSRICTMLEELGYLHSSGEREALELTDSGQVLRRIFNENDLLLSQCMIDGVFDGLDAQEIAAVASGFVFESRQNFSTSSPHFPGGSKGKISHAVNSIMDEADDLGILFDRYELETPPSLDFSFVQMTYEWSAQRSLSDVLEGTDITPGDFVRSIKRVIDILRQISLAAQEVGPVGALSERSREICDVLDRGVVSYSNLDD
jgi:ATP-dependent RNA helicase HelY